MLVIGLHGWFLHPIAILLCDMVVYAEFLIHPVVLLSTSTKLRHEIGHTLKRLGMIFKKNLQIFFADSSNLDDTQHYWESLQANSWAKGFSEST